MVSGSNAHHTVKGPHMAPHTSSLCRSSYLCISGRPYFSHKSSFDEDPCVNMGDMDRRDIVARKDGGISLVEFYFCHTFGHTNEAVSQELVEDRLPSRTNMYN